MQKNRSRVCDEAKSSGIDKARNDDKENNSFKPVGENPSFIFMGCYRYVRWYCVR
jgi:hypothetical protein